MSGPLASVDYSLLAAFLAGAGVVVWSTVVVTGFFPRKAGPAAADGLFGAFILCMSTLAIAALIAALVVTASALPWAVCVIAAGLATLGAPFLVQPLPERFRNSLPGLMAVLLSCATSLLLLSRFIPA